tara:strand:- start:829 stop:957 length:129 start_codon:yes stop_codon:yes gene_type:complete
MGWLYRLNKAEKFLGLPISKDITESEAMKRLNLIKKEYKLII